jgi:hypothetical protein
MAVQSEFGYNHFSLENRLDDLQVGILKYFFVSVTDGWG